MFQFKTQQGRISGRMPGLAVALALGAMECLAVAGPSRATELFLISDALTDPGLLTVKGPGVDASVYASPLELELAEASGPGGWMGDLVGFFMNMLDFITAGWNGQQSSFQASGASGGGGLSRSQTQQIGGLADYGAQIIHFHAVSPSPVRDEPGIPASDGDLSDPLAGIQGAIWQIENPTYTVSGGTGSIQTDLTEDLSLAGTLDGSFQTVLLEGDPDQRLAVASDVPEPSAWALMALGALAIGVMLRRARTMTRKAAPMAS